MKMLGSPNGPDVVLEYRAGGSAAKIAFAVISRIPTISGFEIGMRDGERYCRVTVSPFTLYGADRARAELEAIASELDPWSQANLLAEWNATPPDRRSVCKIVRDNV